MKRFNRIAQIVIRNISSLLVTAGWGISLRPSHAGRGISTRPLLAGRGISPRPLLAGRGISPRPFLLLLLLLSCSFISSDSTFTINEPATNFTTDNLGNAYLINGPTIRKFDSHGIFQKEFSNKNFGAVSSVDATNALRIVLFYRDFNRVIFLDNTMSQNGDPVQLEALGFPLATLAAYSHDNGLWIYDQQNFELIRFNRSLQIEQRTGNLSQVLGIDSLQPDFILEKDNRLFLHNPSTGIMIFDIFGTYSKTIPVKDLKNFQVEDDNIIWFAKEMNYVNIRTLETGLRPHSEAGAIDQQFRNPELINVRKEMNSYYFFDSKKLVILQ